MAPVGPAPLLFSPLATLIAISSFLVVLLSSLLLIKQIRARNLTTAATYLALLLNYLMHAVNALLWPHDQFSRRGQSSGRILCDAEVKALVGTNLMLFGSIACIFRDLNHVLNPITRSSRLWEFGAVRGCAPKFTIVLTIILPVLQMGFSTLIQPRRFALQPIQGCKPLFVSSWPTVLILHIPMLVYILLTIYNGVRTSVNLYQYRRQTRILRPRPHISAQRRWYKGLSILPLKLSLPCPADVETDQSTHLRPSLSSSTLSRIRKLYASTIILFFLYLPDFVFTFVAWLPTPSTYIPYRLSDVFSPDWSDRILIQNESMPDSDGALLVAQAVVLAGILGWIFCGQRRRDAEEREGTDGVSTRPGRDGDAWTVKTAWIRLRGYVSKC